MGYRLLVKASSVNLSEPGVTEHTRAYALCSF